LGFSDQNVSNYQEVQSVSGNLKEAGPLVAFVSTSDGFLESVDEADTRPMGARIRAVRGAETLEAFATQLGVHKNTLARYEKGERQPEAEFLRRVSELKGIDPGWLLLGRRISGDLSDDFAYLPRYDVDAAAGAGALVERAEVIEHLPFRKDWIRLHLRRDPRHLVLIQARGDSMVPTIADGDLLFVDISEPRIGPDAIYALGLLERLIIKRVQVRATGRVILRSDNPRYEPEELDAHTAESLRVLGEVCGRCGAI